MNWKKRIILYGMAFLLLFNIKTAFSGDQRPGEGGFDTHPMHWARFWARAVLDRNLIYLPLWNIGNLADSRLSPSHQMKWPGSQGLSYGGQFNFFIGSEVFDMRGHMDEQLPDNWNAVATSKPLYIVTDAFKYGAQPTQVSKDKTHQQIWAPMPGYFNDGAYGWIWGINEDTNRDGELQPNEDINFNGQLDLNVDPPPSILKSMAISTDKRTWPEYWPVGSYVGDDRPDDGSRPPKTTTPGKRAGIWNGEYKAAPLADQETYYKADDHENDRWNDFFAEKYYPMKKDDGTPDDTPWKEGGIYGAGIEMEARSYVWFHPLAEDLVVSIYRVRNYSDYTLYNNVTGMFSNSNAVESTFNEVSYIKATYDTSNVGGRNGFDIMYQWHKFPEQIETYKTIGEFGFAFLESPGIDYNGIDDDADYMIDEAMNDGIDNDNDWRPFEDIGLDRIAPGDPKYKGPDEDGSEGNGKWDTEDKNLNGALDKGEDLNENNRLDMEPINDDRGTDGIGPDENGWPGPDPDGTEADGMMELGEPNFDFTDIDEADQAGLKHIYVTLASDDDLKDDRGFWAKYLDKEGENVYNTDEDISFIFGARSVKLEKDVWKRFAIAMVMGQDHDDVVRNKATMQNIYDHNYKFLTPPLQPTVVSNVTDRQVILTWDSDAETSKDPFFGEDFEGYRVYKSTDPKFLDIKKITDAFGNVLLFKPLAIYDKADGLFGAHPVPFPNIGVHYDMGHDSGLRHSFRDTIVENGRTYYYAVNSIDAGNDWDFYERGLVSVDYPLQAMPSESGFNITVNELGEVVYRDRNTAVTVPVEPSAGWIEPFVDSLGVERSPSGFARGGKWGIRVYNKDQVRVGDQYEITFDDDHWLDNISAGHYRWGSTKGVKCMNLTSKDTVFYLMYDNAYLFRQHAYIELEKKLYEGLHFNFSFPIKEYDDERGISIIKTDKYGRSTNEWKKWQTKTPCNLRVEDINLTGTAYALPFDFEIRIGDFVGSDSAATFVPDTIGWFGGKPLIKSKEIQIPVNFSIWNVTFPNNPEKMKSLIMYDKETFREGEEHEMRGQIWDSCRVSIRFPVKGTPQNPKCIGQSSTLVFNTNQFEKDKPVVPPQPGDVYLFRTYRNPTRDDTLRYVVEGKEWNKDLAQEKMRNIYVVPDPYVVASTLQSIYELAGSTQRRVDFVNLPPKCTIRIFTADGKQVRKIDHDSPEDFGRESWDLATEDGPEVAFGIYFFVVQADGMDTKRGKFAIIK